MFYTTFNSSATGAHASAACVTAPSASPNRTTDPAHSAALPGQVQVWQKLSERRSGISGLVSPPFGGETRPEIPLRRSESFCQNCTWPGRAEEVQAWAAEVPAQGKRNAQDLSSDSETPRVCSRMQRMHEHPWRRNCKSCKK